MKFVTAVCAVLIASSAWAGEVFSAGEYVGQGTIVLQNGASSQFDISATIVENPNSLYSYTVVDVYLFPGNVTYANQYDLKIENSILSVHRNGVLAGTGYCVETSCHMDYSFADTGVAGEETVIVNGSSIDRIGSRTVNGVLQYVKTTLSKTN